MVNRRAQASDELGNPEVLNEAEGCCGMHTCPEFGRAFCAMLSFNLSSIRHVATNHPRRRDCSRQVSAHVSGWSRHCPASSAACPPDGMACDADLCQRLGHLLTIPGLSTYSCRAYHTLACLLCIRSHHLPCCQANESSHAASPPPPAVQPLYSALRKGRGLPPDVHLLSLHDDGEGVVIFRLINRCQVHYCGAASTLTCWCPACDAETVLWNKRHVVVML